MCVITEPAKSLIPVLLSLGSAPLRLQCPFRSPGNLVRPNADSDSTGLGGGQDSPALTRSQQLPPAAGPLPHRAGLEETVRSLFRFPVPLKIIIVLFFIFLIQNPRSRTLMSMQDCWACASTACVFPHPRLLWLTPVADWCLLTGDPAVSSLGFRTSPVANPSLVLACVPRLSCTWP